MSLRRWIELEFGAGRSVAIGFVRPITQRCVARVTAAAQAQARFLDDLRLTIPDLQGVRTIGFNRNRAILAQGDLHAVDCNRSRLEENQGDTLNGTPARVRIISPS